MSECQLIDPLVTPFIDDELGPVDQGRVARHVSQCPPCHSRVEAERQVRSLLKQRQASFRGECAPVALRVKCATHCGLSSASRGGFRWRERVMPLALAATVVLGVAGGVLLYQAARAPRLLAAELVADHAKCFAEPGLAAAHPSAAVVDAALARFGWTGHVPEHLDQEQLELVGVRSCQYGGERVAHILYRHHDQPVSLFLVPKAVRPERIAGMSGHEYAMWQGDARTYVMVSREPRAEVERLASIVQPSFR